MKCRATSAQAAFVAYLARVRGRRYAVGRLDCCLFVAGAVEAMTGLDLAFEFRGYDTKAGGFRALRRAGFSGPVDVIAARFPAVDPGAVRALDVVFVGGVPMIAQSRARAYAVGSGGVGVVPLDKIDIGFRVV